MKIQNLNQNHNKTIDPPSSDYGATSLVSSDRIRQNHNENEAVIFDVIAPHPQPVVIGELLTEIEGIIKRHVVLPEAAATALAVWVLHTYVYELRDTVAYVAIESPEKRCGKTTLLTVLGAMANKPLIASNVTVGALFRAIDTCRPTLLIDEADTFLAGNTTMRGVINSGNTWRTAYVLRMSRPSRSGLQVERQSGGSGSLLPHPPASDYGATCPPASDYGATCPPASDYGATCPPSPGFGAAGGHGSAGTGLKRYSCWCPKVIAMIGRVPDTIADRSIVVSMARKLTTEIRAPLAKLNTATIKAKCARFALDHGHAIGQCEKIHGEGLNDRAADTFDPLYVVARLAGTQWEEKLHAAALVLSPVAGSKSTAAELLLDIYSIFLSTEKEKIFTRQLTGYLRDEEFNVTSAALKDSAIDEQKIAQLLRPYGIKPSLCRVGSRVARGYLVADFTDAIARYVPEADLEARAQEVKRENKLFEEADAFEAEREGRNSGTVPMR